MGVTNTMGLLERANLSLDLCESTISPEPFTFPFINKIACIKFEGILYEQVH